MMTDKDLKEAALGVLKRLGYEVELKERPKMPEPFLKKDDEFWYVNDCPLQVVNATVVAVAWEATGSDPCLEVTFDVVPLQPYGTKLRGSFHILESEMGKFYFNDPQKALIHAWKILEGNNKNQGELCE